MRHRDLEMPSANTTEPRSANPCQTLPFQESGAEANSEFLTAEEVSARYRRAVSVGTLRNWRAAKIGPTFVKIGRSILYPLTELKAWDQANMVKCRRRPPPKQISSGDG
jgi:hypothetical protein